MSDTTSTASSDSARSQAKVKVGLKRTINLGDYNSLVIEFGIEDYVPPGQNPGEFMDYLYSGLNHKLVQKMTEEGIVQ